MCDTYVSPDPTVAEISEMTALAAEEIKRFGLTPKVALLSHSNFGSHDSPSAVKMREALVEITRRCPDLEVEGEMHADSALSEEIRARIFPNSRLKGQANLLVMPDLDAANIAFNMTQGDGRRPVRRSGAAGRGQAGAHPDAVGHGARHRQHVGAGHGGRPGVGFGSGQQGVGSAESGH